MVEAGELPFLEDTRTRPLSTSKECWNPAADAYDRAGDEDASRDAASKSIERTLAMADTVPSSSAKAH